MKDLFLTLLLAGCIHANAQIQVDRPIQLTGGNGERSVLNLEAPVNGTDAVNKDYVDTAVAATGGGDPTMISDESATAVTFGAAIAYCRTLTYGGYSDWHMPTYHEVISVVSRGGVTVPNASSANNFWFEGTTVGYSGGDYYGIRYMRLSDGYIGGTYFGNVGTTFRVRCVR